MLLRFSPSDFSAPLAADPADLGMFAGADLGLEWALPFVGLLLSIAIWPLVRPGFWHRHYGKISFVWAMLVVVPMVWGFGAADTAHALGELFFHEYLPFVILLLTLFTLSGGVRIYSRANGTPLSNLAMLTAGTAMASFVGTTGASMLLIRPLLRANSWRRSQKHVVIFFIFLVSNIGGSLTPLGDPPLFLGFLQGVDFFWPTHFMLLPMLVVSLPMLALFYLLDHFYYRREGSPPETAPGAEGLRLEGGVNLLLLVGVLLSIILSGFWSDSPHLVLFGIDLYVNNLLRDAAMLVLLALSLMLTAGGIREQNNFTWEPILEVAKLFAGIFTAILPVMAILRLGTDGSLAFVIESVSRDGAPNEAAYFWVTGILSSFLDNAPTYLLFFNVASGDAALLMDTLWRTLLAISCGAVFMGSLTYIGNAPNLMVRAVAQEWGVAMPSFFGYMAWAVVCLFPMFLVVTWIFF
ncbi:MAG: sodium:proton antiporter [Alphaproteobacteria bacterium]|nr:sodium:proton antiporter [Alphaproteobacteria bacterium]